MPILTKRLARCRATVDEPFPAALQDARNAQTLESVRGNATRFEWGFFAADGSVYDLSQVQSINLKIKPNQTTDTTLADQTVAEEDLDLTLDAASWADGSKAHVTFDFTNAEMNLDPQGTRRTLWIVVTALMADGTEYTLAGGAFFLHEDNNITAAPPPENPGTAITLEQADARYQMADVLEVISLTAPPVDGVTTAGALGQRAIVTTTNSLSGAPITHRDVWTCTLFPDGWTPPGNIFRDRGDGLLRRQYTTNGGPETELAYP